MLTNYIDKTQQSAANNGKNCTIRTSASLLLTGLISFNAIASDSDSFAPGDSGSKWVVGGYVGSFNNPLIGEGREGYAGLNIEYRGEKLFVKDNELGYNLYRNAEFSVGVLLTGNGSLLSDKNDYKNNSKLVGLKERDGTLDAGFYLMHKNERGRLKVKLLDEITGKHSGMSANVDYMFDYKVSDWNITPYLGANWNSANMVNHFYGVSIAEATVNRAAYSGNSTVNLYTGINGRYDITPHWDIEVGASYIHIGKGIRDSSIVNDSHVIASHVGVNYNF
ncbi:Outer membrane scaffolding protein for murein synthesis, MipA/OmpV family [Oceanospirillum multiglobuliferum]|uniref:Uncharacterized protein n=1 Tax=Oceanospirillum multiglobuliferum TaxID=64969 RepID=A0A1T4PFA5_9GAMM|nr:MipA/OmpV family protein [Oceanospirillum multiglobuliferum]OPX55582.1 hypothetical protein BTE48_08175 [Oceanospirillum multiglobuliferum]SJZ90017.1 Outer membrane scaffolding protein for murein synthesis, MipA/OmpV family [Oceanospirillum multiglobuliferum]